MSNTDHNDAHLHSRVIHGGQYADPVTGAVMPPISLASTYAQPSPGEHRGFEYTRSHNPTRYALERCVANLEGSNISEADDPSCGGFAFASGLASTCCVLDLLDSGDHVVAMDDLYGGTYRLFSNVKTRSAGIDFTYVDMTQPGALEDAITDKTRLIWVETPTNPTMKIVDLEHVAKVAKEKGGGKIITCCDNTFASPILQRPLEHGFDIAMHSSSKYLGGHSDVIGGQLVANTVELAERIRYLQNATGPVMAPFDSYMTLRGIKTLAIRMEKHCANAQQIAEWLETQSTVERVVYPGLESHPQYTIAQKQMRLDGKPSGGGMITVYLDGGLDESRRFLESLRMFALAESLGGVESLVDHPAIMTHASVPPETRKQLGIHDNLVRLSVGVEHVDDLLADLDQALSKTRTPSAVR